jgi:hypothetical protein
MWTSASHIPAGAHTTSTELVFRDYPPSRHYVAEQHQALKRRPAKELSKTARRTTAAKDELIRATVHRALHGWAATDQLTRAAPRASAAASPWLPQLHEERQRSRCPRSLAQRTSSDSVRGAIDGCRITWRSGSDGLPCSF